MGCKKSLLVSLPYLPIPGYKKQWTYLDHNKLTRNPRNMPHFAKWGGRKGRGKRKGGTKEKQEK